MGYRTYNCDVARACGGCQWLNVPYPIQLKRKQEQVAELFGDKIEVEPIVGMDDPLHYRNKAISPIGADRRGHVVSGLFREGTHRIVASSTCLVESELARAIIGTVASLAASFRIQPYDEDRREGVLRYVQVRDSHTTGEVMVTLVVATETFPSQKRFVAELRRRHPEISTVILNVNPRDTNVVLGTRERTLFGGGFITDDLCGCSFRISSRSFFQTNPVQTEKLYSLAMGMAELSNADSVIDAYCGIGTIGIIASRGAGRVIGVESNADAVGDARANARHNGAGNIEFLCEDATRFLVEVARLDDKPDVVFLDPPRSGSTPAFCKALIGLAPSRVIYISCNPITQVRDIEMLQGAYRLERVVPVDMFPHTPHVETVALLARR